MHTGAPGQGCSGIWTSGLLAWHDSSLWEVTREEVVIHSDILVANCILFMLQLNDSVN